MYPRGRLVASTTRSAMETAILQSVYGRPTACRRSLTGYDCADTKCYGTMHEHDTGPHLAADYVITLWHFGTIDRCAHGLSCTPNSSPDQLRKPTTVDLEPAMRASAFVRDGTSLSVTFKRRKSVTSMLPPKTRAPSTARLRSLRLSPPRSFTRRYDVRAVDVRAVDEHEAPAPRIDWPGCSHWISRQTRRSRGRRPASSCDAMASWSGRL